MDVPDIALSGVSALEQKESRMLVLVRRQRQVAMPAARSVQCEKTHLPGTTIHAHAPAIRIPDLLKEIVIETTC